MRLSKLQWQILDLALVEYEKPALIQCPFTFGEYHDPGGYERAHSRTITVKQLVKLLYNVELGGYWHWWENGVHWHARVALSGAQLKGEKYRPSSKHERRDYASGAAALSRSLRSLRSRGVLDTTTWAVRLSPSGAALARDAKKRPVSIIQDQDLVNRSANSVTRCACGVYLDAARSTKRYCSAACRQTAFRMRAIPMCQGSCRMTLVA